MTAQPAIRPEPLPRPAGAVVTPFPASALPAGSDVHFHVHHHYAPETPTAARTSQVGFPWTMPDDDNPEPRIDWNRPSSRAQWDRRAETGSALLLILVIVALLVTVTLAMTVWAWVVIPALETLAGAVLLGGVVWLKYGRR